MKLLTADEMRGLDRQAIEDFGVPGLVLMENAGRGATDFFCETFAPLYPGPVLVLAGKGNNGGDGYVIARHLANRGWQVRTIVLAERQAISGDAAVNLQILLRCSADVEFAPDEASLTALLAAQREQRLIIDAIFGNGLNSEVRGHYALAIDWINSAAAAVAAVDMPSGIEATSGRVLGRCVKADCSAIFALPKLGQMLYPAAGFGGRLQVVDIGMPGHLLADFPDRHLWVDESCAAQLVPVRPSQGHKGTFGHLLVIAASTGKTGAAGMTAVAGLRSGAGLVTLGCPAASHAILASKMIEVMTAPLADVNGALSLQAQEDIRALWQDKTALALGPGLGQHPETFALVRNLLRECPVPLVVDADGLNALAEHIEALVDHPCKHLVLTPHPGEMARLLGTTVPEVESDRVGVARRFAERYNLVLVLKGARTVIAFPDGRVRINSTGNPGMASGGMGDVLTGIIGGLLAQGLSGTDAAVLGVYLHGLAGDRVADRLGQAGLLASDLLHELPAARSTLTTQGE